MNSAIVDDKLPRDLAAAHALIRALHSEKEVLRAERDDVATEKEAYRKLYTLVKLELERIKRQMFGQKAEKVSAEQIAMTFAPVLDALERAANGDDDAAKETQAALAELQAKAKAKASEKKKKKRSKHGRRKLSEEDLPVDVIVIEPPERLADDGEKLIKIGEEVSETFEYRRASVVRLRVVRPKYKVPDVQSESPDDENHEDTTAIVVADLPPKPIERCMAGASLLAYVLVSKYGDHLPLARQERIFKRQGLRLSRSTLWGWISASANLLKRITDAMWEEARDQAHWVGLDASGVLVQQKEKCKRGHFWVLVSDLGHVLYRYTDNENGDVVAKLMKGFSGYVQADASAVYHELYRQEVDIIEVGCHSHARRKFFNTLDDEDSRDLALTGIGFIKLIYEAHDASKDDAGIVDGAKRNQLAGPLVKAFYEWVESQRAVLDDEIPVKKALNYVHNHKAALTRFLDDGALRLDNNLSELALRHEKIGSNNWLFLGSARGAEANTVTVSLIATCTKVGLCPQTYLHEVLSIMQQWPVNRVAELSPLHWARTRESDLASQLLAAAAPA